MFIRYVDESLARFLRAAVPLPPEACDISFDVPSATWAETLERRTVNLFLFDITRSSATHRPTRALDEDGKNIRRRPQPMVELNYMVSTWGGGALAEHQLLGEIISRVAGLDSLPADVVAEELSSSIHLSFVEDDRHRARDIWNGAGNTLRAGFSMHCTVAADTFGWTPEPTAVTGIQGIARRAESVPEGSTT